MLPRKIEGAIHRPLEAIDIEIIFRDAGPWWLFRHSDCKMALKSRPGFIMTNLQLGNYLLSEEKRVCSIGVWHCMGYQEMETIAIVITPIL